MLWLSGNGARHARQFHAGTAGVLHALLAGDSQISPLPTLKRRYYIDLTFSCNAILVRTSNVSRVYR